PEVLKLAHAILEGHGYRVLDAATPGEAIARAELPGEKIHLLLTDVIMPGLNGPELYNTLREFAPGLKVLYMSGYTDNAVVNNGLLEGDISYLQKPFTAQSLVRKVRVALDA
ncbi:MAG TPA: response regulator, partial [Spirochaetes bacterium]|nr:response regulator [Spirochaetota bacterium]